MFGDTALTNRWGPTVGIEAYYACLFPIDNTNIWIGPRTGLEAAWMQGGFEVPIKDKFSSTDYLDHQINYTVEGAVRETYNDISVAIPVMVGLKYRNLIAGLGLKVRGVVWSQAKTAVSELNTTAYFPDFDITVTNEPKLGAVTDASEEVKGSRATPEWHVAIAAEIGYEFEVAKHHFLGVRLFATYDIWNSYKLNDKTDHIWSITAPTADKAAASVSLNPLYNTALTKLNALTVGVTLSYTFEILKASHHCNCLPY